MQLGRSRKFVVSVTRWPALLLAFPCTPRLEGDSLWILKLPIIETSWLLSSASYQPTRFAARAQPASSTPAPPVFLPDSVVKRLGLPVSGRITVRFADGRHAEKEVASDVEIQIQGRSSVFSAVVEPGRSDALIGAIVLEEVDFVVDCVAQRLVPRDPHGLFAELD